MSRPAACAHRCRVPRKLSLTTSPLAGEPTPISAFFHWLVDDPRN